MITKERLEQIGKSIMTNAVTATGFSPQFNKMRNIKSNIQIQITDQMSFDELQDVAISKKNNNVIEKLVTIGKKIYSQNPTDENAYMVAVSIGTIIKEYGWDNDYIAGEKLYVLVNKIVQDTRFFKESEYVRDNMEEEFDFDKNGKFSYSIDVAAEIYKNINTQEEANTLFFEQIELFFKSKGKNFIRSKSDRLPYFDEIIYKNDEQTISVLIEKNEVKSVKTITFLANETYSVRLFKEGYYNKCLFGLPIFTMQLFDDIRIFIHFMSRESYLQFDTPKGRMEKDLFDF